MYKNKGYRFKKMQKDGNPRLDDVDLVCCGDSHASDSGKSSIMFIDRSDQVPYNTELYNYYRYYLYCKDCGLWAIVDKRDFIIIKYTAWVTLMAVNVRENQD